MIRRAKCWLFSALNPTVSHSKTCRAISFSLICLIFLNVVAVIFGTVEELHRNYRHLFLYFEIFSITVFSLEYILRLWSCTADEGFERPIWGRIKFVLTPMALIDLLAVLPFFLPAIIPLDLRFLRAVRLFRLFRLMKIARYSESFVRMARVFRAKKEELVIAFLAGCVLLVVAASLMYFFENEAQPDKFGSIPAAMWWAVVTLTTVGYGDIYPITAAGKVIAGAVSLIGVGLVALPAGIIASGFMQEIQRPSRIYIICPYCGKDIDHHEAMRLSRK